VNWAVGRTSRSRSGRARCAPRALAHSDQCRGSSISVLIVPGRCCSGSRCGPLPDAVKPPISLMNPQHARVAVLFLARRLSLRRETAPSAGRRRSRCTLPDDERGRAHFPRQADRRGAAGGTCEGPLTPAPSVPCTVPRSPCRGRLTLEATRVSDVYGLRLGDRHTTLANGALPSIRIGKKRRSAFGIRAARGQHGGEGRSRSFRRA
jgi:hypothetical protein